MKGKNLLALARTSAKLVHMWPQCCKALMHMLNVKHASILVKAKGVSQGGVGPTLHTSYGSMWSTYTNPHAQV